MKKILALVLSASLCSCCFGGSFALAEELTADKKVEESVSKPNHKQDSTNNLIAEDKDATVDEDDATIEDEDIDLDDDYATLEDEDEDENEDELADTEDSIVEDKDTATNDATVDNENTAADDATVEDETTDIAKEDPAAGDISPVKDATTDTNKPVSGWSKTKKALIISGIVTATTLVVGLSTWAIVKQVKKSNAKKAAAAAKREQENQGFVKTMSDTVEKAINAMGSKFKQGFNDFLTHLPSGASKGKKADKVGDTAGKSAPPQTNDANIGGNASGKSTPSTQIDPPTLPQALIEVVEETKDLSVYDF